MIVNSSLQNIQLPSNLESIHKIENFIDEFCEDYHIDESKYGNILIALTEAINNAITHGNKLDASKMVNLELESDKNMLKFKISDQGNGFDLNKVPDPTLPENINKVSGRGVYLMKNLADEVKFSKNGTSVELKFSISAN